MGEESTQQYFTFLAGTTKNPVHLHVDRAKGVYLYDNKGRRYLDMIAGISVNNLGHNHPAIVSAVREQLDKFLHVMVYGDLTGQTQVDLARELAGHLPGKLRKIYFVNSGSEAIEGALKLSRRFTGRHEWIAFRKAYHGSTMGALSVMGGEYFKRAFRPLVPGTRFLDFNDPDQLNAITDKTAAVLVEPVQGEAGIILPEKGYLEAVRQRCDETGTLLIFDEVQTGFGRTGEMFAFQKYKVQPDILVLAKALGGGLPLGAFISSSPIMETLTYNPELGHITTFGGHPLSCAAGLASLRILSTELPVFQIAKKAKIIRDIFSNHPLIKEVRGTGLLFAIDTGTSGILDKFVRRSLHNGLITDFFLFDDSSFRISPPLTISEEELTFGCRLMLQTLEEVSA
ncbi:MAG: aspartate aminotransferase family protein [Chlorobi bacterium]|nr:aspartate aminotransferase family protein [Chlorobiota bacterium]